MKPIKTIVAIAAITVFSAGNAFAGGFLADVFVRPLSPQLADELDKAHERAGKPLDRIANEALKGLVGGAGRRRDPL